ncbi:hypothetical protein [Oryzomicrobium sp.]|uniref:hypothetical protein n=1 Tax=Oryzomicrobium sp. TaxID=1911578 RepID=UPI0025F7815C|nr:hypothetical protein [Oryzomicrobium sp.]MCE1242988.1 hypothetical protein [Oryzomicrobium sp.]
MPQNASARSSLLPVWAAALVFAVSQANLARLLAPLNPSLFALQLAFTPDAFWRVIEAWGPAGVAAYRAHFPYDFLHPFLYGAFGYLTATRTALLPGRTPALGRAARGALPVAGLCDLAENALHLHLLALAPGAGGGLVTLSGTCSLIKWGLAAAFALALGWGVLRHGVARLAGARPG